MTLNSSQACHMCVSGWGGTKCPHGRAGRARGGVEARGLEEDE
jgi:hypothetical protein